MEYLMLGAVVYIAMMLTFVAYQLEVVRNILEDK